MEMLNLAQRLFVDEHGDTYPITNLFNFEGDECGPEDAVAAVAGTEGRWFSLVLSEFNAGVHQ